jgi:hypothetical protein
MKQVRHKSEILLFIGGFIIGVCLYFIFLYSWKSSESDLKFSSEIYTPVFHKNIKNLYETELADKLRKEVRILCWVFTHPDNHRKKVPHVRNTWGKRCDKLLFMSIQADPEFPDIVALPIDNGKN